MDANDEVLVREREGTGMTEKYVKLGAVGSSLTGTTKLDEVVDLKGFKKKVIGTVPKDSVVKLVGLHMLEEGKGIGKLSFGGVELPDLKKNMKKLVKAEQPIAKDTVFELASTETLDGGKVRLLLEYTAPTFVDV